MNGRLNNKVAIVTGGASGFGAGIAQKFAAEGAQVLIADRELEGAMDVAALIGPAARALRVDVADAADVRLMMEAAEQHFGRIDILINNAGVTHLPQPLEDVSEADFDRVYAVNMKAIYLAMREAVPRMKANAVGHRGIRGVVLNMASTAGVSPRPRLAWYNASKGWVITATRANAVELAPFGIRVVALNPVAGRRRCSRASWARTRPRCAPSSCRPSRSAASASLMIWPTPPPICAATRPA